MGCGGRDWPGEPVRSQAKELELVLKVDLIPRVLGKQGKLFGDCLWLLGRGVRREMGFRCEGEAGLAPRWWGWAGTRAGAVGWEEVGYGCSGGQVGSRGDCCPGGEEWLKVPALN